MENKHDAIIKFDKTVSNENNSTTQNDDKISYEKPDLTYTVDEAVDAMGYGKFQILLLVLAGLGWMADAFEIFILSVIGGFLACEWTLYTWQNALLTSIVFVGIAIGSPILGVIADVYGRKKCLAVSAVLLFIFGMASAASPSYTWMVVFRGSMGFAVGGVSQGLTLCTELCPKAMRGKSGFYLCYFWSLGSTGVALMTWVVMVQLNSWRKLLAFAALPAFVVMISLVWYPESPRYYLVSHQYNKAKGVLESLSRMNGKPLPPGRLMEANAKERRGRFMDLLNKEYWLTTVLFWYIWLASAFSYYGVALLSPTIIQHGDVRVESNGTYGKNHMENKVPCSHLTQQDYIDLLWTSAAEFPGLILFTILVERMRRKLLLEGAFYISAVLLLLLLLKTKKIVLLIFLFALRGILLAAFQLIFIVTSETYPTTFRAIAMGFSSSFCRIGGLTVPYVAQVLLVQSAVSAMCVLSVVVFFAGIASAFLPFETKGADMVETASDKREVIKKSRSKFIQKPEDK